MHNNKMYWYAQVIGVPINCIPGKLEVVELSLSPEIELSLIYNHRSIEQYPMKFILSIDCHFSFSLIVHKYSLAITQAVY